MANDWHAAWYQEGKEDSSIAQRHKSGDVFKHIENFVKTADGCANEHVSPYTSMRGGNLKYFSSAGNTAIAWRHAHR